MKLIKHKDNIILILGMVYGLFLLYVLFLRSVGNDYALTYTEYLKAMNNFIPFFSIYILFETPVISSFVVLDFLKNFVGNILLFIPWGFLLPQFFKKLRKFKPFLMTTLILLFLIETIQLLSMLGIFDIEDILLNMTGASLGFCINKKIFFGKIQT